MRPSTVLKSVMVVVSMVAGTLVPSPTGAVREVQVDLVESLFVSPVRVEPLGAHG